MPYIVNDAALKYRESENDQWETAVVHADAEVQAVVQSSEPTGTETLWFDNSNQTDVQVPTWGEFNELKNTFTTVKVKDFTPRTTAANGVEVYTDTTLTNRPIAGYQIGGISSLGGSGLWILALKCDSSGLEITYKNLTGVAVTPTSVRVFYI